MKLLLVFALCGVTGCLAGPTCSIEEVMKCSNLPRETIESAIDGFCKQLTCQTEIYDRCGDALFQTLMLPIKAARRYVEAFCDRSAPLRKKYLENLPCIHSAIADDAMKRLCGLEGFRGREEFCRDVPQEVQCAVDFTTRKCGKDVGEIFRIHVLPFWDSYDCLSS